MMFFTSVSPAERWHQTDINSRYKKLILCVYNPLSYGSSFYLQQGIWNLQALLESVNYVFAPPSDPVNWYKRFKSKHSNKFLVQQQGKPCPFPMWEIPCWLAEKSPDVHRGYPGWCCPRFSHKKTPQGQPCWIIKNLLEWRIWSCLWRQCIERWTKEPRIPDCTQCITCIKSATHSLMRCLQFFPWINGVMPNDWRRGKC